MSERVDESGTAEAAPRGAKLTRGSIRGHLIGQTAPMIIGIAALVSVGIIDAYYIGQLGAQQLAAVAFIFPVTQALSSLGVGVMAGIASVVSRALGRGEDAHAQGLASLGFVLAAGIGLVLAIALFVLRQPLFTLMQAEAELLPLIDAYMMPFALGFALLPAMMGINGALRAQGEAKKSMTILLTMAGANWVLDPILITGAFGFAGFGIAGAAYATLASWLMSGAVGFMLLQRTAITLKPAALRNIRLGPDSGALARVAGPAAFSNSINPVGLSILTAFLAGVGQDVVAAFGAGGRVQAFAVVPLLGLSSSIGGIVGQNWGARLYDRAQRALMWSGGFSLVYGLAVAAIMVLFRDSIAGFFTDSQAVRRELASYLLIASWGYAGFGIFIVANGALNAIDHAGLAMMQSLARVLLIMVPAAWLWRGIWSANGVYAAELAANLVGAAIAVTSLWWVFRRVRR